jgi:PIN domain
LSDEGGSDLKPNIEQPLEAAPATTPREDLIHVLIDTSIYSQHKQLTSAAFRTLKTLCRENQVRLYVPLVVKGERITQTISEAEEYLDTAASALNKVSKLALHPDERGTVKEVRESILRLKGTLAKSAERFFDDFVIETNAQVELIASDHAGRVFEDYFSGGPPFKRRKNRDDIPDAFIFQAIRDLSTRVGSLYAVTNDTRLGETAGQITGVMVFRTINEFIQHEPIQRLLKADKLNAELAPLVDQLKRQGSMILELLVQSLDSILISEKIPPDGLPYGEAWREIDAVLKVFDARLNFDTIEYYGEATFLVSFDCVVRAETWFYIEIGTYHRLSDEEQDSMQVDHYHTVNWTRNNEPVPTYPTRQDIDLIVKGRGRVSTPPEFVKQPGRLSDPQATELPLEVEVDQIHVVAPQSVRAQEEVLRPCSTSPLVRLLRATLEYRKVFVDGDPLSYTRVFALEADVSIEPPLGETLLVPLDAMSVWLKIPHLVPWVYNEDGRQRERMETHLSVAEGEFDSMLTVNGQELHAQGYGVFHLSASYADVIDQRKGAWSVSSHSDASISLRVERSHSVEPIQVRVILKSDPDVNKYVEEDRDGVRYMQRASELDGAWRYESQESD